MMAPRRDTRQAGLFRMSLRARPADTNKRIKGIPPYELGDVITALRAALKAGKAMRFYNPDGTPRITEPDDSTIRVCLEEIAENKRTGKLHSYTLRFSYLNPLAADRGKRDLKTSARTFLKINSGEVGDVGAHLVISPPDSSGKHAGLSKCVLEQMPGLARSKIDGLIGEIAEKYMSSAARPIYEYAQGKGAARKIIRGTTRLKLGTNPEKSKTLEDDLSHGALKKVRFLGGARQTDSFSLDGLEDLEEEITADVKLSYRTGAKARKLIDDVRKRAKSLGVRAQIDIEKEEDGVLRPKTRELDLDKAGLADQLFSRIEIIKSTIGFPECYSAINADTVEKLIELIDSKECWS